MQLRMNKKLSMKSQSNENDNTRVFFNYKFLCVKLWFIQVSMWLIWFFNHSD